MKKVLPLTLFFLYCVYKPTRKNIAVIGQADIELLMWVI
jgi:hypothetical protein